MKRGYEERHYDSMLIVFHALCVSEHRQKPEVVAAQARAYADAFVAELVKIDEAAEDAELKARLAVSGGADLTHDNAEKPGDEEIELNGSDTEPPPPPPPPPPMPPAAWKPPTVPPLGVQPSEAERAEQAARLAAQQAESNALALEVKS